MIFFGAALNNPEMTGMTSSGSWSNQHAVCVRRALTDEALPHAQSLWMAMSFRVVGKSRQELHGQSRLRPDR